MSPYCPPCCPLLSMSPYCPTVSVLDSHCKAHDLDNLYVVDASCFVSASAVNPSLTIIANAIRIADHL